MSDLIKEKIKKSCAVCKFANHDPGLNELEGEKILCIVDVHSPEIKDSDDTCLKHRPKYKNLKVIVEPDHLEEYDPERAIRDPRYPNANVPTTREIGADEWKK